MKATLKYLICIATIASMSACHKGDGTAITAEQKRFLGVWVGKVDTEDTVIFFDNGTMKSRGQSYYTAYNVLSTDTIELKGGLIRDGHKSNYRFISDSELYIDQYISDIDGNLSSGTLIKQ